MILKYVKYSEYKGQKNEWILQKSNFEKVNLIVGVNSSGKTRTLNVINGLSNFFIGDGILRFNSGDYEIAFEKNSKLYIYKVQYEKTIIENESLIIDGSIKLERDKTGVGQIFYEKEKRLLDFSIQKDQIAATVKRDKLQHPFLEDLYNWGKSVRHYSFGSDLGKNNVTNDSNRIPKIDPKDTRQVIAFYMQATRKNPLKFKKILKKDFARIGYEISDIGIGTIAGYSIQDEPIKVSGLWVQETGLKSKTEQMHMSQGMFRAISLIIQINALIISKTNACILIDDIGEGIDFDRSSKLIKLFLEKVISTNAQILITTNDRFTMNTVDLNLWSIIDREGSKVKIFNYQNSKEIFDEFGFSGLNNFDFLTSEYWKKQQ